MYVFYVYYPILAPVEVVVILPGTDQIRAFCDGAEIFFEKSKNKFKTSSSLRCLIENCATSAQISVKIRMLTL